MDGSDSSIIPGNTCYCNYLSSFGGEELVKTLNHCRRGGRKLTCVQKDDMMRLEFDLFTSGECRMYPSAMIPRRGHLYWAQVAYIPEYPLEVLDTGPEEGEVRAAVAFKTRPVLVVQNDRDNANPAYPYVLVAAVHSAKAGELRNLRRRNYPTDFILSPAESSLKQASVVFLNQLITIHKNLLQDYIGGLPGAKLTELNVKLAAAVGLAIL